MLKDSEHTEDQELKKIIKSKEAFLVRKNFSHLISVCSRARGKWFLKSEKGISFMKNGVHLLD